MTRFVFLFAVILALASAPARADSPSCLQLPNVVCATGADTVAGPLTFDGAAPFVLEGATGDAFETTIAVTDPTADRTVTLPDADSATATAIDCSAGQHVDSFDPATGLFACTADSGGTHDLLSATHTDTVASTFTRGDLIVATASGWDDLAIGGAATFLRSDGTDAAWTAISAADIGAGDLANVHVWNEACTASPCTLANSPRTADEALVFWRTLKQRRVTSCGTINEYTLSGTTLTLCDATGIGSGADSVQVTYAR
jgi:hypothetical protein